MTVFFRTDDKIDKGKIVGVSFRHLSDGSQHGAGSRSLSIALLSISRLPVLRIGGVSVAN
jgi:hypothetical protein